MKLLKSNESSYTSTALLRTKSSSEFHGRGGGEGRELPMTGKKDLFPETSKQQHCQFKEYSV